MHWTNVNGLNEAYGKRVGVSGMACSATFSITWSLGGIIGCSVGAGLEVAVFVVVLGVVRVDSDDDCCTKSPSPINVIIVFRKSPLRSP